MEAAVNSDMAYWDIQKTTKQNAAGPSKLYSHLLNSRITHKSLSLNNRKKKNIFSHQKAQNRIWYFSWPHLLGGREGGVSTIHCINNSLSTGQPCSPGSPPSPRGGRVIRKWQERTLVVHRQNLKCPYSSTYHIHDCRICKQGPQVQSSKTWKTWN